MSLSEKQTKRWWEEELLLLYHTSMGTVPGFSWENKWQEHADPAIEVDVVAAANALQTHCISFMNGHITNKFCYFKSEHFKEQRRDYLAAYLTKSRVAGYRTIVYFNVHAVKPDFGQDHPDWRQIYYNGTPKDDLYGVETTMCVNTGFRDWVRDVCLDLCKYPIDGIFFDGPCFFMDCCYCQNCQKLYREQHGTDMPPKEPGHPNLRKLAFFQAESLRRFFEHSNTAIKAVRPDVALYGNSGPRGEAYYAIARNNRILIKSQDILLAEGGFVYGQLSIQPVWRPGSNAKYYETQAGGKPTIIGISSAHGPWRSYYRPDAELRLTLAQAVVHGSGATSGGFKWFREQPAFEKIAFDFRFFRENQNAYIKTKSRAKTAILWPEDSINFYGKPEVLHGDFTQGGQKGEKVGDIHEEFNGFYDALLKNHICCDIIDEESVRNENIGKYDLLILPNVSCTGQVFDKRFRKYVRDGGNVLASFETSICDENGARGEDLSLADVFGIHMLRTPLQPFPHFYFFRQDSQSEVFADILPKLLPAPLISSEVTVNGATVISPHSIKFKGWDGSEIIPSEFPAITMNNFGKGKAVYLAGVFGSHYWRYKQLDIRLLLRNLFNWLNKTDIELENAPTSVELVHREANDGAREMVHLINYTGGLTRPFESIQTLENITIRIRSPRQKVRALRMGAKLITEREGAWLKFSLPRLEIFETIIME